MDTTAEVLGVYTVEADEPVYLLEIMVHGSIGKFNITEFTQEIPSEPQSNWQVPYDEKILNHDGDEIVANAFLSKGEPEDWIGDVRLAFFFHYLDFRNVLASPFGDLSLPAVSAKPNRLDFLVYDPPY